MIEPFPTVAGPDEADAFVAARVAEGANHLKIFIEDGTAIGKPLPLMSPQTVTALIRAAHERGLRTVAHTLTRSPARQGHRLRHRRPGPRPADGPSDQALIEAAAAGGVFVVPTLTALTGMTPTPAECELAARRAGAILPRSRACVCAARGRGSSRFGGCSWLPVTDLERSARWHGMCWAPTA